MLLYVAWHSIVIFLASPLVTPLPDRLAWRNYNI